MEGIRKLSEAQTEFIKRHHNQMAVIQKFAAILGETEGAVKMYRSSVTRQKAFLRGMGSVLEIFPDPNAYKELLSRGNRINEYWSRVGGYIWQAMGNVRNDGALKGR